MDATGEGIQKAEESGNAEESGGKAAGEPRLSPLSSVPLLSSCQATELLTPRTTRILTPLVDVKPMGCPERRP